MHRTDGWGYEEDVASHSRIPVRRMTLFPPDITLAERRILAVAAEWPFGAAVLTIFLMIVLADTIGPVMGMLCALGLYVLSVVLLRGRTRELRSRLRIIEEDRLPSGAATPSRYDIIRLRLLDIDARQRHGDLTAAAYRAEWARIYRDCSR